MLKKILILLIVALVFTLALGQNIKTHIEIDDIKELKSLIQKNGLNHFPIGLNEGNIQKDYSILGYATKMKKANIVDYLLTIDSLNIERGYIDEYYEYNCAFISIENNSIDILKKLVDKGAVINQPFGEYGYTCIFSAVETNNIEICKYLLAKKVDPNPIMDIYEEAYHFIPLIKAVENENIDIVRLLLENGADLSISNNDGVSARVLISNNCKLAEHFKDYLDD